MGKKNIIYYDLQNKMSSSDDEGCVLIKQNWKTLFMAKTGTRNFRFKLWNFSNCKRILQYMQKKTFSISHGGFNDVKRHAGRGENISRNTSIKANQTLSAFVVRDHLDTEQEKIEAAEITKIYHDAKHTHSFNSVNCDAKISSTVFSDSKIAAKLSLARTKASCFAHNVLDPASLESSIKELTQGTFFDLSTDASNHGNIKLFPILVRFYSTNDGIKLCLLDFYEETDETATGIFKNLEQRLQSIGLNFSKISNYSADNASVNFFKPHSVFTLLKKENDKILPMCKFFNILHLYQHLMRQLSVCFLCVKIYGTIREIV